jgi:hypothetical protein
VRTAFQFQDFLPQLPQINKQTDKQTSKQASKQANKQANKQRKQASKAKKHKESTQNTVFASSFHLPL